MCALSNVNKLKTTISLLQFEQMDVFCLPNEKTPNIWLKPLKVLLVYAEQGLVTDWQQNVANILFQQYFTQICYPEFDRLMDLAVFFKILTCSLFHQEM